MWFKSKVEIHLFFNQFHNNFSDIFFSYITYLGDGLTVISIVIIFLFVKFRSAILIGLSHLFSSLLVQILKHTVFVDSLRPSKFFEGIHPIYLVPGIENYSYHSFPSGHASNAFALFFCLALINSKKSMKFFFFVLAVIVAFSRVYLSQHFFADIYAGSLIGMMITFIVFYFMQTSSTLNKMNT